MSALKHGTTIERVDSAARSPLVTMSSSGHLSLGARQFVDIEIPHPIPKRFLTSHPKLFRITFSDGRATLELQLRTFQLRAARLHPCGLFVRSLRCYRVEGSEPKIRFSEEH